MYENQDLPAAMDIVDESVGRHTLNQHQRVRGVHRPRERLSFLVGSSERGMKAGDGGPGSHAPHERMVQPAAEEKEERKAWHTYFFKSVAWNSVKAVLISVITVQILDAILKWRSGFLVFLLMAAVCVLWWFVVMDTLWRWSVSSYDYNTKWDVEVSSAFQTTTITLVIITGQYGVRFLFNIVNSQSLSLIDIVIYVVVITIVLSHFQNLVLETKNLEEKDRRRETKKLPY